MNLIQAPSGESRHSSFGWRSVIVLSLLVLLLYALVFGRDLGSDTRVAYDEYHTLARSRAYLISGDWLSVRCNCAPSFKKPPLQYMVAALCMTAGMRDILAVRLPGLLGALGVLACAGLLAHAVFPDRPYAVAGSIALLAASRQLAIVGRLGVLDTWMISFLLLSVSAVLLVKCNAGWWIVMGLSAGLGALQKAPVALGAATLFVICLSAGSKTGPYAWSSLRKNRCFWSGLALAVGLSLLWPVIQTIRFGPSFFGEFFVQEMAERFAVNRGALDPMHALRWMQWLAEDNLWVSVIFVPALVMLLIRSSAARRNPLLRGVLVYVLLCALALSLAGGDIYPKYILMFTPFLAVLTAAGVCFLVRPRVLGVALCAVPFVVGLSGLRAAYRPYRPDRSRTIEVCAAFSRALQPGETAVFCRTRDMHALPAMAVVYYADLDREIVMLEHGAWDRFDAAVAGKPAPYRFLISVDDLDDFRRAAGPVRDAVPLGAYVIGRVDTAPRVPAGLKR